MQYTTTVMHETQKSDANVKFLPEKRCQCASVFRPPVFWLMFSITSDIRTKQSWSPGPTCTCSTEWIRKTLSVYNMMSPFRCNND